MVNRKTSSQHSSQKTASVTAYQHPWCQRLLTVPDTAILSRPIDDSDPLWESIEAAMVRLGSLSHGKVDLNQVAEQCLTLLERKTKDMRVLAHLLHCLQQQATPALFITALALLDSWLTAYWNTATPDSDLQKQRIMIQIMTRFDRSLARTVDNAQAADLAHLLQQAQHLHQHWQPLAADQQELIRPLINALQQRQTTHPLTAVNTPSSINTPSSTNTVPPDTLAHNSPPLPSSGGDLLPQTDRYDERRYKQTLLNIARQITESHPHSSTGYRLRRHAIWSTITSAPLARNNKTELAAVCTDRISDYQQALAQGDTDVLEQIEHSLTLAPYWFDGHRLSAQAATQRGCPQVAAAIRDELNLFLQRLPALKTLTFSDATPFLPPDCAAWLTEKQPGTDPACQSPSTDSLNDCYRRDGLHAALTLLNQWQQTATSPRQRFYHHLALADLLHNAGIAQLAQQHYFYLWQETRRLALDQWEPEITERLRRHIAQHGDITDSTGRQP